jgi:hypothetical protein
MSLACETGTAHDFRKAPKIPQSGNRALCTGNLADLKCRHLFPEVLFVLTRFWLLAALEIKFPPKTAGSGSYAS